MTGKKLVFFQKSAVIGISGLLVSLSDLDTITTGPAQALQEQARPREEQQDKDSAQEQAFEKALRVPVFPKGQTPLFTGNADDLHGMFIQLEDGSVLSLAQWVLGGLRQSGLGAGMTEAEENRFLGTVAREAAGLARKGSVLRPAEVGPKLPRPAEGLAPKGLGGASRAAALTLLNFFGGSFGVEKLRTGGEGAKSRPAFRDGAGLLPGQYGTELNQQADDLGEIKLKPQPQ